MRCITSLNLCSYEYKMYFIHVSQVCTLYKFIYNILGSSNETQVCGDWQGDARVGHPQERDPGGAKSCLPPRGPGQAALIPQEGARG